VKTGVFSSKKKQILYIYFSLCYNSLAFRLLGFGIALSGAFSPEIGLTGFLPVLGFTDKKV